MNMRFANDDLDAMSFGSESDFARLESFKQSRDSLLPNQYNFDTRTSQARILRAEPPQDLVDWVNYVLEGDLQYISELCTGAAYCQLIHMVFPGALDIAQVKFGTMREYEFIKNMQLAEAALNKLKMRKFLPITNLCKGLVLEHMEFLNWFKSVFETYYSRKEYDPLAVRRGATLHYIPRALRDRVIKTSTFDYGVKNPQPVLLPIKKVSFLIHDEPSIISDTNIDRESIEAYPQKLADDSDGVAYEPKRTVSFASIPKSQHSIMSGEEVERITELAGTNADDGGTISLNESKISLPISISKPTKNDDEDNDEWKRWIASKIQKLTAPNSLEVTTGDEGKDDTEELHSKNDDSLSTQTEIIIPKNRKYFK